MLCPSCELCSPLCPLSVCVCVLFLFGSLWLCFLVPFLVGEIFFGGGILVTMSFDKRPAPARAPLSSISGNVAKPPPSKRSKLSDESVDSDRLLVFSVSPSKISSTVSEWLAGNTLGSSSNSSQPGALRPVDDTELLFFPPEYADFGPCWVYFSREKKGGVSSESLKLLEAGTNSDSPRSGILRAKPDGLVPRLGLFLMVSHSAFINQKKIYMYHVLALAALLPPVAPSQPTISTFFRPAVESSAVRVLSLPETVLYTTSDLESCSQSKTARSGSAPKTIMHLCGNKFCMNPKHFFVGPKIYNDEQAFCHKGLHNACSLVEYLAIQTCYCKHVPVCWAMPYRGQKKLVSGFCGTGRSLPVVVDDVVE